MKHKSDKFWKKATRCALRKVILKTFGMFPQKHSKQTVFVKSFGIGKMEWFMEGTNECSVEDKCHAASTP